MLLRIRNTRIVGSRLQFLKRFLATHAFEKMSGDLGTKFAILELARNEFCQMKMNETTSNALR